MNINMNVIDKSMKLRRKESYLGWAGRCPYAKPVGLEWPPRARARAR